MKINLKTGQYYSFNTPEGQFGLDTAIQIFKERGYSVPKGWIKNHWNLILWKLAGMVALEPERERDQAHGRWSWDEALRQLIHR
jgi:breast cancer 2 susceptibility protein